MKAVWIWLLVINILSFLLYGVDKHKAVRGEWRIPEDTLIGLAAMGGGAGAYLGMHVFHHKTRHLKFRILVPLFLVLWIVLLAILYNVVRMR